MVQINVSSGQSGSQSGGERKKSDPALHLITVELER